jgi:hypothetical protein
MVVSALAALPAPSTTTAVMWFAPATDGIEAIQPTRWLPLLRSIVASPLTPELLCHLTLATRRLSLATPANASRPWLSGPAVDRMVILGAVLSALRLSTLASPPASMSSSACSSPPQPASDTQAASTDRVKRRFEDEVITIASWWS